MYTITELICTLIAIINLTTAIVTYYKYKTEEISTNTGKYYQVFRICMIMSLLFGLISLSLLIIQLE